MTPGSVERDVDEFTAIEARLHSFAQSRNWLRHHSPKNLGMSLAIEVGELLECFQWLTDHQARKVKYQPTKMAEIRSELADVFIYLIHLADALDVDLLAAARDKIEINERRFPPKQQS
jgi:NTP pyrophosphatase (non-canonical NTP hydrolase)